MKLFTKLCDSTVNVFENILIETKLQRDNEALNVAYDINKKIQKHFDTHRLPPLQIQLGKREAKYFPTNYRYAGKYNEIIIFPIKHSEFESEITILVQD